MVVTGEKIILKRFSPLRQNILFPSTLSSLYFLLRVYVRVYALARNVPYILHAVCCTLHVYCVQYVIDMVIVNGDCTVPYSSLQ